MSAKGGDPIEGRVRDVSHGGDAVVETARGIVLARGALPGERVQVSVESRRGGVQRGKVLALIEASPDRIEPVCEVVKECGGCPLMTLASTAQAQLKLLHLQRVLQHVQATVAPEWIGSPRELGYRARARLGWVRPAKAHAARIGYRAAGSDAIVDVERCAVLAPELERGLHALRARLTAELQGEGEIALGLGAGGQCVAELRTDAPQPPVVYAACEALVAARELAGVALHAGGRELAAARFGDPHQLGTGVDGKPLLAPPGAFTQANPEVNARLVARAVELAAPRGAKVLELFAGHGNFTVGLAALAAELQAVEADAAAAEACRQNLRERGLANARVVEGDAARAAQGRGKVDVVVLDPPRAGARAVLPGVVTRRPRRIVYVSCDAASLRRDLGELAGAGYRVDAAAAFDMFPQTSHLEALVRLTR
jgi:23S rRNA (uracil1939-C5)-methyltransferase